jgi:hypothetical protein
MCQKASWRASRASKASTSNATFLPSAAFLAIPRAGDACQKMLAALLAFQGHGGFVRNGQKAKRQRPVYPPWSSQKRLQLDAVEDLARDVAPSDISGIEFLEAGVVFPRCSIMQNK